MHWKRVEKKEKTLGASSQLQVCFTIIPNIIKSLCSLFFNLCALAHCSFCWLLSSFYSCHILNKTKFLWIPTERPSLARGPVCIIHTYPMQCLQQRLIMDNNISSSLPAMLMNLWTPPTVTHPPTNTHTHGWKMLLCQYSAQAQNSQRDLNTSFISDNSSCQFWSIVQYAQQISNSTANEICMTAVTEKTLTFLKRRRAEFLQTVLTARNCTTKWVMLPQCSLC